MTKRDVKYIPRGLKRMWNLLFWEKCILCKKEFVREPGWSFINWSPQTLDLNHSCICGKCCPDKQSAIEVIIKYEKKIKQIEKRKCII